MDEPQSVPAKSYPTAKLWHFYPELQARLNTVPISAESRRFVHQSTGEEAELSANRVGSTALSVTDGNGFIVRTASSWLRKLRAEVGHSIAPGTLDQYGKVLSYLCRWIDDFPPLENLSIDENIRLMNRTDLLNWLTHMNTKGAAQSTRQGREACIREFFTWLCTKEAGNLREIDELPWGRDGMAGYVTKKTNAKSPKFIDTLHVVELLKQLHNECERCMFHSQYDMGLRISELVDLRREDLPAEKHFNSSYEFLPICINGVKGRGGQIKERISLISRALLRRIMAYHNTLEYKLAPDWAIDDPKKPVFLTANQLKWSERNASKQFKAAVNRAELPKAFCTHWLRHGTAFSVLRSDVGKDYVERMLIVQQMLGHSDLKTTEIYTQISPQMLAKLTKKGQEMNRLEEAEQIRSMSYLGPIQHKEKRGHRDAKRSLNHSPARAHAP